MVIYNFFDNFLGYDKKLNDPEELFDIPAKYRCAYVGAKMDRALIGNVDNYQQYMEIPHEPFISSGEEAFFQLLC